MKSFRVVSICIFSLIIFPAFVYASNPKSGFFLPDSIHEMTLRYRTVNDLIVLMIDTGSSLGLLLKTTNISEFSSFQDEKVLGMGLNGPLSGFQTTSKRLVLEGLELERVPTGIVSSSWHNNASIGMDILKEYVVILNYCKAYACFKLIG